MVVMVVAIAVGKTKAKAAAVAMGKAVAMINAVAIARAVAVRKAVAMARAFARSVAMGKAKSHASHAGHAGHVGHAGYGQDRGLLVLQRTFRHLSEDFSEVAKFWTRMTCGVLGSLRPSEFLKKNIGILMIVQ